MQGRESVIKKLCLKAPPPAPPPRGRGEVNGEMADNRKIRQGTL